MTERPILFSGAEVRAILAGTKTQARRIVKPHPDADGLVRLACQSLWNDTDAREYRCPFGVAGDRLWVKETWQHAKVQHCLCSQASEPVPCDDWQEGNGCRADRGQVVYGANGAGVRRWRPSVHMPRWASRITLEVTGVRVQRVQDISEEDAMAEGCAGDESGLTDHGVKNEFAVLWNNIHGPGAWERNEWVFAVSFKRLEAER